MTMPAHFESIEMINEIMVPTEPGYMQEKGPEGRSLPLAGLHVKGQVLGSVIDVEMKQRFKNTYADPIEAVYIFPLPGAAAVYHFDLKVADRVVSGEVQERQLARKAYQKALNQGHRAALMEQERDDVYTLQVGNIPAGEEVEICLKYVQNLDYREQGLYECRIPTVVAPRYIPGGASDLQSGYGIDADTDVVADASRISPPRLAPGFDPKIDLSIQVAIDASQGISDLACTQHANRTRFETNQILVSLAQQERLNRDFVLRWRTFNSDSQSEKNKSIASQLFYSPASEEHEQGFGLLQIQAPAPLFLQEQHRDIIFLLDRSGSMGDYKMAAASQACDRLLNSLGPGDRFAIQAFDHEIEWLYNKGQDVWLHADELGKEKGRKYLRGIESRGGTELFSSIREALKQISVSDHRLPVLVLLTDGQVGDESRILKEIQSQLGDTLVHTIGIDTALNDAFLHRLSRLGGGTHLSVAPRENIDQALEEIASEIGYPALQNIQLALPELTPNPVPNLYLGRSLSLFFRGDCPEELVLEAMYQNESTKIAVKMIKQDFSGMARLWAHSQIQQLEDAFRLADWDQKAALKEQMIAISCAHQVLCRMTSWLAVDEAETIEHKADRQMIVQPVEMPEGWESVSAEAMVMESLCDEADLDCFEMADSAMPARASIMSSPMPASPAAMPPPPMSPMPAAPLEMKQARKLTPKKDARQGGDGHALVEKMMRGLSKKKAKKERKAEQSASASEDCLEMISAFLKALKSALEALNKKEAVDWQRLKQMHLDLTQLLQHSDQAECLPALQRLLRQESKQLLHALESGHLDGLSLLTARCQKQMQKALAEQSPSWEQSI